MTNYKELFNSVVSNLILDRDPLGFFLSRFEVKFSDGDASYTDGSAITISKQLVDRFADAGEDMLRFVLLHETLHIFFNHFFRGKNYDGRLWNIATDYEINNFILTYYRFSDSVVYFINNQAVSYASLSVQLPDLDPNMIAEEVYKLLIQSGQSQNSNDSNNSDQTQNSSSQQTTSSDYDQYETWNVPKQTQESKDEVAIKRSQARQAAKMSGNNSGKGSLSRIEEILLKANKLDVLVRQLKKIISKVEQAWGQKRYTRSYTRYNKINPHLPGSVRGKRTLKNIVLVVDESASFLSENIAIMVGSVINVLKKNYVVRNLTLIQHDVDIVVTENIDVTNVKYQRKLHGGTSHGEVYQWLINNPDPDRAAVIFITDAESDISLYDWTKIKAKKFWLTTDNDKPDIPANAGVVIKI